MAPTCVRPSRYLHGSQSRVPRSRTAPPRNSRPTRWLSGTPAVVMWIDVTEPCHMAAYAKRQGRANQVVGTADHARLVSGAMRERITATAAPEQVSASHGQR